MKNEDAELIQRTVAGDDTAFSELVKKYQRQVHALAWRKTGDFHTAEDITQDTFLKAYQRLHTLKQPHRFAGWLYVIANRQCLAWFRQKRLNKQTLENIDTPDANSDAYSRHIVEEQAKTAEQEQQEVVKKLLETLKESDRTVITLHYFAEMTCEQMSEFLGVSANTIKSRLRRARNRLKQEEPMIREAITNFKISPTLTENIMQDVSRISPTTPSASKPLIPWMIGATGAVLIVLMFGIGGQFLAQFQKPYSLDAQAERTVELIDAPIVQNLQIESDNRNQTGNRIALEGSNDGNEENANQTIGDGDYTKLNLPEGAKRRLGKGVLSDMKISPNGTHIAIASSSGIWLYNVNAKQEMKQSKIALLTGHEGVVRQLTFSPDSKMFASIGLDKTLRLWESTTGKLLFTLTTPKPTGEFRAVKFIRDGKILAGRCSDDYKVYLWDVTTGKYLESFRPKLPMIRLGQNRNWQFATDAFFDPIGNIMFAVGNKDGTISIQEGRTGLEKNRLVGYTDESQFFKVDNEHDRLNPRKPTVRRSLVHPGDKLSVPKQLKADGTPFPIQYLLSDQNHSSHNYEKIPTKWINTLDFSPDGNTLVSRSKYMVGQESGALFGGGPTEIWDVETGEQLSSLTLCVTDVEISGDGKTLAITGDGGVSVWDIPTRQEIAVFNDAVKVLFSGNGKTLIIIEHERYILWDITTRRDISSVNLVGESFTPFLDHFGISHDDTMFATTDTTGKVNVWETRTSTQLRTFTTGYTDSITGLMFTDDGKTLISGTSAGNIEFWDTNTANIRSRIKTDKRSIDGLMLSTEDNTTLTVMSNSDLMRWDVSTGQLIDAYTILNAGNWFGSELLEDGTQIRMKAFSFTPNGERLTTPNSKTKMIDVWDITEGKNPRLLTTIEYERGPILLSPDGAILASTSKSNNAADLWITYTSEKFSKISFPENMLDRHNHIYSLAFSHDGKTFVGGTKKREIHLWNFARSEHIGILKAHKHVVCALKFSPDNTILASGDTGGGICLWKIPDRTLLSQYKSSGGYVSELAFSPDGKTLASTNGASTIAKNPGGTIYLWDVPTK